MYDFIEMLWKEKYRPSEKNIANGREIDRAEWILDQKEQELFSTLNEKQCALYEEISDMLFKISELRQLNAYIAGAQLVSKIIKELS